MLNLKLQQHDWSLAYLIESNFRYVVSEQEAYGWKMDVDGIDKLMAILFNEIDNIRQEVLLLVPKRVINQGEVKKVFKKDGDLMTVVERWYNNLDKRFFRLGDIVGVFTRVTFEDVNLESPVQRINTLQKLGWTPTEYNYKLDKYKRPMYDEVGKKIKSSPKLTEDSVKNCEVGQLMVNYLTISHRHKFVKGLSERLRTDGRIGSGGITVGCNTGRMMHRNIVNVPSVDQLYGKEIRSLFTHSKDYTLIGADLKSLENRLMGHYTFPHDNGEYAGRLESEDSHNTTVRLVKSAGKTIERSVAKTLNYAIGFGAQIGKVAEVLDCNLGLAKKVHDLWWSDKSSMKTLKECIEKSIQARGQLEGKRLKPDAWIKGLDGRKIYVRSSHSLINALIQNAGAVVAKFITCSVDKAIRHQGLDAHMICIYHDEINLEVKDDEHTIRKVKEIIKESIDKCNKYFKFRIPMDMDIKVGANWATIH